MPAWDEMALVGFIARAHGIRGQVVINPETDFLEERFRPGAEVFVERAGRVETLRVETMHEHRGRPIVGFAGVEGADAAALLAGLELRVPVEALERLPPGSYYWHDLVGCAVETTDGERVGVVSRVDGGTAGSRLIVAGAEGGEIQVPFVAAICPVIDPAARRIVIAPPAGLLDLNAPRQR